MSLAVTRDDLLREIGQFAGWGRQPSRWDEQQRTDGESILSRGLRQSYYPTALPGDATSHKWSFLTPVLTLATKPDIGDYDLPEDFAGMTGDLFYVGGDAYPKLTKVPVETILAVRQSDVDSAGYPCRYAVTPTPSGGRSPQAWTLMLHPRPQSVYEFRGRYRSDPLAITGSASYPLGGQMFADALTASCVAAADQVINDKYLSETWMTFQEKLRTAIFVDRQENFTGNLGYNGDGQANPLMTHDAETFTINGVSYGAPAFYFDQ